MEKGKVEEPSQRSLNDVNTGGVKKVLKVRPKKPENDVIKKLAVSVNPAASFPLIPIPEPQFLITTAAPTTPASSWSPFSQPLLDDYSSKKLDRFSCKHIVSFIVKRSNFQNQSHNK